MATKYFLYNALHGHCYLLGYASGSYCTVSFCRRNSAPKPFRPHATIFFEGQKKILENRPMQIMIGLLLIITMAEAFRNALSLFFMKSVIQADGVGTLYFIYFVAGIAAVPFWLRMGRKLGKHIALAITLITVAIISLINMFFSSETYWLFVCFFIAKGACFGGLQFLPLAILADVIDVETAETGSARAGSYVAFASMVAKISTALGTFWPFARCHSPTFRPSFCPQMPLKIYWYCAFFMQLCSHIFYRSNYFGTALSLDGESPR